MIKLRNVDETILTELIYVILSSGYRPIVDFPSVKADSGLTEGLYDVAIITNGEDR